MATTWENVPVLIALPLALAAALMSVDGRAPQQVSGFLVEALAPQAADLGGDPGYLLGEDTATIWALPQKPVGTKP